MSAPTESGLHLGSAARTPLLGLFFLGWQTELKLG
jgi:hypothetical protein